MVVSLANVSPTHASRYYEEEGMEVSSAPSEWYGHSCQRLGLSQSVHLDDFKQLLTGRSPNGTVLVDKTRVHQQQMNARATGDSVPIERAGLDLTASAPKSVSLQALVFGDRRLEAAHQQANREMLRVLEERYAFTRITQGGQRLKVTTGAMAIACFHHATSRALDPQLHTHNVILNLQRHPQTGRWQSLDNREIYHAKMLLGQIYRNELAWAVQDLGYSLAITNARHGLWELQGFNNQQLRSFSTRLNQIEEAVGVGASSQAQAWANRMTRPAKVEYDRDTLVASWQQQAQALGMAPLQPVPLEIPNPQLLLWLSQCFNLTPGQPLDRKDLERQILQKPGVLPFATLQQMIDTALSHHSGINPYVLQRTEGAISQTNHTTEGSSASQRLPGNSPSQSSGPAPGQTIRQTTAAIAPATSQPSSLASQPATYAAGTDDSTSNPTSRTRVFRAKPWNATKPRADRSDPPTTTDDSAIGDPPAGGHPDRRLETAASEPIRVSPDAGGDGEASRLGQDFRALDEFITEALQRHERRTMVRTEDQARFDGSCADRADSEASPETSTSHSLVQPLEADDAALERER